jgi:Transposase DNA-binding/Transposase DDE domain
MDSWGAMRDADRDVGLAGEYEGSGLGDVRRQSRLKELARALEADPAASLPKATKTDAALEAAYRFLRNDAISMDGILAGHYAETAERAAAESVVLAVHDTTDFEFTGEATRDGLGPLRGSGQGFFGHFTLLIAPGELRRPLGVIAVQTHVRTKRRGQGPKSKRPVGEAARWKKGVQLTEERIDSRSTVLHVMDREGDSYELWAELLAAGRRFVIRNGRKRLLAEGIELSEVMANGKTVVEREVKLSRRRQDKVAFNRKRHPARAGRMARLALSAQTLEIPRPARCDTTLPEKLVIHFVHVRELATQGNEPPVDWLLATTEPISTAEDIERVVDFYRARWVIEEYFKSLKTGCAYEKRQLESEHTLFNLLAVLVPVAWRLLLLRSLARDRAEAPATESLTPTQVQVLIATSHKKLSPNPTVREALLAIAALGGHIKNNGEPGWAVIGRGFEELLTLERGWKAAKRSDQ